MALEAEFGAASVAKALNVIIPTPYLDHPKYVVYSVCEYIVGTLKPHWPTSNLRSTLGGSMVGVRNERVAIKYRLKSHGSAH